VIFFKTRLPVEPVSFVEKICEDTASGAQIKNCRYVKRLTPITAIDKATTNGLEAVAKEVLAPHFHGSHIPARKVSFLEYVERTFKYVEHVLTNVIANTPSTSSQSDLLSETIQN
jgi:tRNA acetyltransferase TAN1